MLDYGFGKLIKNIRLQKGMTQRDLCENIVDLRHIKRIENGISIPKVDTINLLSMRLGVNIMDYYQYSFYDDPFGAYNFFESLKTEYNMKNRKRIYELSTSPTSLIYNLPEHVKILSWYRIFSESYLNNTIRDGYSKLIKLLSNYYNCKENLTVILDNYLDSTDYRILASIAKFLCEMDKMKEGIELYKLLISRLQSPNQYPAPDIIVPMIYNLTNRLYDLKDYNSCIKYAMTGKKIALEHGNMIYLGDIFSILGNCYEKLGSYELSVKYYSWFLASYEMQGLEGNIQEFKEQLNVQYDGIFR